MTQSEIAIKDLGLFKKTAAHADVQTPLANLLASLMKH
jgi:3-hydroxyisobutyrate dehydrogenase-like beta-hydroxyacid dehydrogenase